MKKRSVKFSPENLISKNFWKIIDKYDLCHVNKVWIEFDQKFSKNYMDIGAIQPLKNRLFLFFVNYSKLYDQKRNIWVIFTEQRNNEKFEKMKDEGIMKFFFDVNFCIFCFMIRYYQSSL